MIFTLTTILAALSSTISMMFSIAPPSFMKASMIFLASSRWIFLRLSMASPVLAAFARCATDRVTTSTPEVKEIARPAQAGSFRRYLAAGVVEQHVDERHVFPADAIHDLPPLINPDIKDLTRLALGDHFRVHQPDDLSLDMGEPLSCILPLPIEAEDFVA